MLFFISLLIGLVIGTLFLGTAILMDRNMQQSLRELNFRKMNPRNIKPTINDVSDAPSFSLSPIR